MKAWLLPIALWALTASAEESVTVCFNYGCQRQETVRLADAQLESLRQLLASASDAEEERKAIALAVGRLYGWAAEQTPIGADRGGNLADEGHEGRMDCIDHSTTADRLLRMIERHGWLRFHRVLDRVLRRRFLVMEHWSAVVEDRVGGRFVVDSWFGGALKPPLVMPLEEWLAGGGEIVE